MITDSKYIIPPASIKPDSINLNYSTLLRKNYGKFITPNQYFLS